MADRSRDVLLAGDERPRPALPLDRAGSAIGSVLAVLLLVSAAVVEDRHGRGEAVATRRPATPSPTPAELPTISDAEMATRLRTARNVARFAAGLVCSDTTGFDYQVPDFNRDVSIATVTGGLADAPPALVVKVTRLPGGISYTVQQSTGVCDG